MTLTQALAALVVAGKIKSAWLPGMQGHLPAGGKAGLRRLENGYWLYPNGGIHRNELFDDELVPDLTDPATVGCLLALVREASGEPHAETGHEEGETVDGWCVRAGDGEADWQLAQGDAYLWPTEGEALAAALIALAEAP